MELGYKAPQFVACGLLARQISWWITPQSCFEAYAWMFRLVEISSEEIGDISEHLDEKKGPYGR